MSSLASVREFSSRFVPRAGELHALVHNAGAMPPERTHTDEGFELTFATNVLGPFLLTGLLLPALRRGAPSRVINVSSGGMYTQRLRPTTSSSSAATTSRRRSTPTPSAAR